MNIYEDFIFRLKSEKIKFHHINMEITSDSILKQNKFCIQNFYPFGKDINENSSQIYDKIDLNIKIQNLK